MSLITGEQTFALLTVLIGLVAFGMWSETKKWGQVLSAAMIILVLSMVLANVGLIPHTTDLYGTISGVLVPIAIPMLLFRADLKRVFKEAGPMLIAFCVAVIATVAGAFVGAWVMDMGEFEPQITAILAASYIGGSVNFVATSEAVQFNDPAQYLTALSADTVGAVIFMAMLFALPAVGFIRKMLPSKFIAQDGSNIQPHETALDHEIEEEAVKPFNLQGLVFGILVSLVICGVGKWLSVLMGLENLFILIITLLALVVANFAKPVVDKIHHEFDVATFFMYTFFAALGAGAKIADVMGAALPMLVFILIMVFVHLLLLVILGKLFKVDLAEALVASNACILGPATAAAMAAGKGWRPLIVPGMLVGVLGYSIATFIGVGIFGVLS